MSALSAPLHAGEPLSNAKLMHIVEGFFDHGLPKEQWTHGAHLVIGLFLIHAHGLERADAMMPEMIRSFNTAKGGINSDKEGYHHTLTIFYLRILAAYFDQHKNTPLAQMCANLLMAPQGARDYPLKHYSKERLFSPQVRKSWVEPDVSESV
ncbi:MAG: hypothetical protein COA69_06975 [Robiginitomaculum sp.]|nr:MAG: hypothetical protein COA69_06975 [Robiginitomaculum sp.]